jgi:hypothetical protein
MGPPLQILPSLGVPLWHDGTPDLQTDTPTDIYTQLEDKLNTLVNLWLEKGAPPFRPSSLLTHPSRGRNLAESEMFSRQ